MGVQRHRSGRIARRGARTGGRADHLGVAERRRHAVVLERPGWIQTLVLQIQTPRLHIDVIAYGVILLQDRLALADGHLVLVPAEVEQLAEPPHAREIQPIIPAGPAPGKVAQFAGNLDSVPVIAYIQQLAAGPTLEQRLPAVKFRPASRVYALLIGCISHSSIENFKFRILDCVSVFRAQP